MPNRNTFNCNGLCRLFGRGLGLFRSYIATAPRARLFAIVFVFAFTNHYPLATNHFLYAADASPTVAVLPFKNLHEKAHLEFVKNIVHEALFTKLGASSVVIGVSSIEDAQKIYGLSGKKIPQIILEGEFFMIRDRLAINVSLLNPKNGNRIEGTGELVKYKGERYPALSPPANFQSSLADDIKEPLEKLITEITALIEKHVSGRRGER